MISTFVVATTLLALQQVDPQFTTVRGQVRDTAGLALADVEVLALSEGRITRTDRNGAFEFDSMALGEQRFLFRLLGYERIEVAVLVREAAEDVVVRMTPLAVTLDAVTVSGRRKGVYGSVEDASDRPLSGVEVLVVGGGTTVTDSMGQFNLPRVRGGTYMLRVRKRGYYAITRSLTLPKDEAMELSLIMLPLPAGLSRGRVTLLSGLTPRLGWALGESDSRQTRCRGGSSVLVTREELAEKGLAGGSLADALPRTRSVAARGLARAELLQYRVIFDGMDYPGPPTSGVSADQFTWYRENDTRPLVGLRVEDVEAVEIYGGPVRRSAFSGFSRPFGRTEDFASCPRGTIWVWLQ
jgi:hypothetical protein